MDQGAIEDFYAAQGASGKGTGGPSSDEDHEQRALLEQPEMSQPEENKPAQNPSGARTLGGASADTSLPEGWGKPKKNMLGRVGDWGSAPKS